MAQTEKSVPMVEMYMSDFGNITAPGLGAAMGNHLKTKVWKWVQHGDLSAARVKEFICSRYCGACKIEYALNLLAEKVWVTGGMLTAVTIDPPPPGTPHAEKPWKIGRSRRAKEPGFDF